MARIFNRRNLRNSLTSRLSKTICVNLQKLDPLIKSLLKEVRGGGGGGNGTYEFQVHSTSDGGT